MGKNEVLYIWIALRDAQKMEKEFPGHSSPSSDGGCAHFFFLMTAEQKSAVHVGHTVGAQ